VVLTGHHAETAGSDNWPERLPSQATIVVYMPGYHHEATAQRLIAAGLEKSMPCAVISQATSAQQQIHRTTLDHLRETPRLPAPTLLVVGEVVRYSDHTLQKQLARAAEEQDFYPLSQTEFPADAGTPEPTE
jgi:siroheme synthase